MLTFCTKRIINFRMLQQILTATLYKLRKKIRDEKDNYIQYSIGVNIWMLEV